jgi:hypothetical protein
MIINPLNWDWNQKEAAGKHVLSYVAGGVTALAAMHFITPQDATGIGDNLNTIWAGVEQVAKGVAGLVAIVVPIYTAYRSASNASPSNQIKNVVTNLSAPAITQAANAVADPESRNKLINAVAEMPEVRAIVAPEAVAKATDSAKVVSTTEAASMLPLAKTTK